MLHYLRLPACAAALALLASAFPAPPQSRTRQDALRAGFASPPRQARMHCYWWWLNGNTNEATIERDLEQMKAKGYGGVILVDANGSNQGGNRNVPAGPMFGSPAWVRLYRYAVREAAKLNLEISLNIQSGWNLGGPTVTPQQASKILTYSRRIVHGPANLHVDLTVPLHRNGFYRDIAVLAYPLHAGEALPGAEGSHRRPIRLLQEKAAFREVTPFSMPVTSQLLKDYPPQPNEEDTLVSEVRNIASQMKGSRLTWHVPAGTWEILRIGYTDSGAKVSTSSGAWQGLVIDYLSRNAFEAYWKRNVLPLIADAQPYVGKSLRYLVTDSWELGGTNWAQGFRLQFEKRRGYDPLPYLPVIAGRIVQSRDVSDRFLNDFRKTIGELIAEEGYGTFARLAEQQGLGIHPESGGPHGAPIDALHTLGMSTFPQTEFWAKSAIHRSRDQDRFFVKEASSAAHIYGKTIVAAEGMTSIGPQWQEEIWNDLKPTFDQAVCAGLNLLFWHTFTSSPQKFGLPGEEYFAGTHLNPNVTWWNDAGPFIRYIGRTDFLMQQGLPVADVLYYYGDQAPNFVRLKSSDPAKALPGYDYDVTDEDVLIHRASVRDGRILLPDGMSYALLATGDRPNISLAALCKIRELVAAGASITGSKPERTTGLVNGLNGDKDVRRIADQVWGDCGENGVTEHSFGKGRVFCGESARRVLQRLNVPPDFQPRSSQDWAAFDYVHRRTATADIYFVRNTRPKPVSAEIILRVPGKQPELWHPDTGAVEDQPLYRETEDGRTALPLHLAPYGSICILFRRAAGEHLTELKRDSQAIFPVDAATHPPEVSVRRGAKGQWVLQTQTAGHYEAKTNTGATLRANIAVGAAPETLQGPWAVQFPAGWGAPASAVFDTLTSWTENRNPGIRYFSGTAIYSKEIKIRPDLLRLHQRLYLDLGRVKVIARVTLNGKDLGIAWKKPFLLPLHDAVKPGSNQLKIAVTNLWPNRLIGDQLLPPAKRFTHTNITKYTANSPLLPSGLLGPVRLVPVFTAPLTTAKPGPSISATSPHESPPAAEKR